MGCVPQFANEIRFGAFEEQTSLGIEGVGVFLRPDYLRVNAGARRSYTTECTLSSPGSGSPGLAVGLAARALRAGHPHEAAKGGWSKLMLDWSSQQISGWLKIQYPADESMRMRVSHETRSKPFAILRIDEPEAGPREMSSRSTTVSASIARRR